MFEDMNSKTTALLMISIMCFVGLLLPFPLAPVTFLTSMAILILSRREYQKALIEGYSDGIVYKLGFTIVACLGNILATFCLVALIGLGLLVTIPAIMQEIKKGNLSTKQPTPHTQINIEQFNQINL